MKERNIWYVVVGAAGLLAALLFSYPQPAVYDELAGPAPPQIPDPQQELVDEPLSVRVGLDAPFTPQAPFAQWDDERYQNACEEAAILIAWKWLQREPLSAAEATQTIADMVEFQQTNYGFFIDSSAEDTARLLRDYFDYAGVFMRENISVEDIKLELARGNLVIVPVNGQALGNPNFTPPGPLRHMVVVIGYDEERSVFVTHDVGTRNGAGFEYPYQVLLTAARDYASGDHAPIVPDEKFMIVVEGS